MAFITDKKEQVKTKIEKFNDFYTDARNKGISIYPFDIYKYVNSFDDIEIINNDDELFPLIGLIEKYKDGFVIAITKYQGIERQREILARLFAHFVLHREYILPNGKIKIRDLWTSDDMSKEANNFASKLLMPPATFETICSECRTFGEVAKYFKVTPKMAKFRFSKLFDETKKE